MIRITIELVPTGINELARPAERVVVGCKFPLNNKSQNMMIFSESDKGYAEIANLDLDELLYNPPDGKPKYLEIANLAIGELLKQKTTREGGEFFEGMAAIEPPEFDQKITELIDAHRGDIQTVTLFGKRVKEVIDYSSFINDLAGQASEKRKQLPALPAPGADQPTAIAGALAMLRYYALDRSITLVDGDYLRKIYPAYIPYDLAIKLDPRLYKPQAVDLAGQHYKSRGEAVEMLIIAHYCTRANPNVPDTTCFNGLFIHYLRPDGNIFFPFAGQLLTPRTRLRYIIGEFEHNYSLGELKAEIKAGNLIYSQRTGQHKCPGKKD